MRYFLFLILFSACIHSPDVRSQKSGDDSKNVNEPVTAVRKPKNIILMIGDGMGLTQLSAGWIAKRDALYVERCKVIGLVKTYSADDLVTDSAAGATAFATGVKTLNGAIGVGPDSLPRKTILEIAEEHGLATGLVAVCSITHATPASFIAHQGSRMMDEEIATDFLKTDIDVFIGGGKQYFADRKDKKNLIEELRKRNYQVTETIEKAIEVKSGKLAGFIANVHPDRAKSRGPVLAGASLTAINILDQNEKGFFLMIEGSQIDWAGHQNNSNYLIEEMLDFDYAIGKALDFAEKDGETLVIITADHETGGYAINGGDLEKGEMKTAFTTLMHTGAMVPLFAFGPGAELFTGIYENTAVFDKMMELYGFGK
ncbi:MAG: alkaline phosphatase [Bacteroidetes bacterium]|nr:alkaline phosphatase [Bacteroidota bacterium]